MRIAFQLSPLQSLHNALEKSGAQHHEILRQIGAEKTAKLAMAPHKSPSAITVADLGGGWGGCILPTSLKVTILAEKSASISNNPAPVRDASPPPA